MAKAITVRPGKFYVRLSDGESPPSFIAPCGFTEKAFNRSKTFGETNTPDCEDGDAPSWTERDVIAMTSTISGQGVLAKQSVPAWEDAFASTESIECEVEIVYADGDSEVYTGFFHVESIELSAPEGQRVRANITMQSDGEVSYTRSTA